MKPPIAVGLLTAVVAVIVAIALAAPALAGSKVGINDFTTYVSGGKDYVFACVRNADRVEINGKVAPRIKDHCVLEGSGKGATYGRGLGRHKSVRFVKITASGPRGNDKIQLMMGFH